jgi:hypothetical protein
MATSRTRLVELSMVPPLAAEIAANLPSSSTAVIALTANTITATTGTLPTPDGTTVIANAATPTVLELQDAVVELRAKVAAIIAALKA